MRTVEVVYHRRMERGTTPCTAITFVRNGGAAFETCLRAALFCIEHVVLDGGSTDGTVELAKRYGCHVLHQNDAYTNAEGRIVDYAGITNQGIAAASHPWVLIICSDEDLDERLQQSIRKAVASGNPGVWRVNRIVFVHGRPVLHASVYPSLQIRFFHRSIVSRFVKLVHEKPFLPPATTVQLLEGTQCVPFDPPGVMARKHNRYLLLELKQMGNQHRGFSWIPFAFSRLARIGYRIFRIIAQRIKYPWKDCMPLRHEWLDIRYPFILMCWSFPPLRQHLLRTYAADITPRPTTPSHEPASAPQPRTFI